MRILLYKLVDMLLETGISVLQVFWRGWKLRYIAKIYFVKGQVLLLRVAERLTFIDKGKDSLRYFQLILLVPLAGLDIK